MKMPGADRACISHMLYFPQTRLPDGQVSQISAEPF